MIEAISKFNMVDGIEGVKEKIIELGEKVEYSPNVYNALSLALVRAGNSADANKIFKRALQEFHWIEEMESKIKTGERPLSPDELSLMQNYV
jgi:hypothetical protein